MSEPRSYEPSMEEILASIRRIIADDQSLPSRPLSHDREIASHIATLPDAPGVSDLVETSSAATQVSPVDVPEHEASLFQPAEVSRQSQAEAIAEGLTPAHDLLHAQDVHPTHLAETPAPGIATLSGHMAQGSVDAPQFAMPDASLDIDRSQAPHVASIRADRVDYASPVDEVSFDHAAGRDTSDERGSPADEGGHGGYAEPLARALESGRPVSDMARSSDTLFSAATDTSVAAAFKTLAAARLTDNTDELLDIARDMIRPLLKTWIDNNLPSMVERLVRSEIERVSRGGR